MLCKDFNLLRQQNGFGPKLNINNWTIDINKTRRNSTKVYKSVLKFIKLIEIISIEKKELFKLFHTQHWLWYDFYNKVEMLCKANIYYKCLMVDWKALQVKEIVSPKSHSKSPHSHVQSPSKSNKQQPSITTVNEIPRQLRSEDINSISIKETDDDDDIDVD